MNQAYMGRGRSPSALAGESAASSISLLPLFYRMEHIYYANYFRPFFTANVRGLFDLLNCRRIETLDKIRRARRPNWLAAGGLAGTATQCSVGAGGGALGQAARLASLRAQPRRHPLARAHEAFDERGDADSFIEFGEVNTEAGWGDFDLAQLRGRGVLETFGVLWREEDADSDGELDEDVPGCGIVVRRRHHRFSGLHPFCAARGCQRFFMEVVFVLAGHGRRLPYSEALGLFCANWFAGANTYSSCRES